jgi:rhodanese-related sulfurtransferase
VSTPTRRFHIRSALRRSSFRIDISTVQQLLAGGAVLVDVRRQDDPAEPLPESIRISPDEVPGRIPEFPRDVPIVLSCT